MFADPQEVNFHCSLQDLPRISSPNPTKTGVFSSSVGDITLTITQNTTANRFRREARFTVKKIAADPLTATNKEVSTSFILTFDEPRVGFTDAELGDVAGTALAWFTAGNRNKLLGGEL